MKHPNLRLPSRTVLLTFLIGLLSFGAIGAQETPTVIFLVRHAEKVEDGSSDPALTPEGEARARALAQVLRSVDLDYIHSTPTRRTLDTATPVRREQELSVRRYDGDALESLADELWSTPGRHLVVGHSNTTPRLVRLLGGEAGPPIAEPWEYDRLYVLTRPEGEAPVTVLLRFGERSLP